MFLHSVYRSLLIWPKVGKGGDRTSAGGKQRVAAAVRSMEAKGRTAPAAAAEAPAAAAPAAATRVHQVGTYRNMFWWLLLCVFRGIFFVVRRDDNDVRKKSGQKCALGSCSVIAMFCDRAK